MDFINWTDNNIGDVMKSNNEVDMEDVSGVNESKSEDGMSNCKSEDNTMRGISDDKEDNSVVNMARDIKGRLFRHTGNKKIELEFMQTFTSIDKYKRVLKDYAIRKCFFFIKDKSERARVTARCGVSSKCN